MADGCVWRWTRMSRRTSIIRRKFNNLSCLRFTPLRFLLLVAVARLSIHQQERLVVVRIKIHGGGFVDFECSRRGRQRAVAERCRRRANVIYILNPNQYRLRLRIIVSQPVHAWTHGLGWKIRHRFFFQMLLKLVLPHSQCMTTQTIRCKRCCP